MSTFVESLKRLYSSQKVAIEKLQNLLTEAKLTQAEYDYIVAH